MKTGLTAILVFSFIQLSFSQSVFDSLYSRTTAEVYFDFGESVLRPDAQATLDSLLKEMRQIEGAVRIRITAHTDSIGSRNNNLRLSQRRAAAVRQGLEERGLSDAEIFVNGAGESTPTASNSTEEGRQRNRRATLEVQAAVPMTTLTGKVKNPETREGIPNALVTFRTKNRSDSTRTDKDGVYAVRLPKDSVVKVEAVAPDYFFQGVMLKVFGDKKKYLKYDISTDLELKPARVGETAVIDNLYFVGNQAVLLPMSEPELPKVLRFMEVNSDFIIEIAGHINQPGKPTDMLKQWEWDLSLNRAKLVFDYLVKNGIDPDRIIFAGYGNMEMRFPYAHATQDEQRQNRRVEIRVLGKLNE